MHTGRIFLVTGTDTAVGKTVLSTLLVRHLFQEGVPAAALKPVASGGRSDARMLRVAQRDQLPLEVINPWHFRAPIAPVLAARLEQRRVRLRQVTAHLRTWRQRFQTLVVESAGGLLSPLGEGFDTRNLILALRAVPLIVAPNRLGGVNQIRLTLGALPTSARRRAIVVLNTPRAGDRAARHNAALVTEWEPATPIIKLPWCPHWQEPAAPLSHTTRQALAAILRAARLDP